MIDWTDPVQVKAYKSGYVRGQRFYKHLPNARATPLARQVMWNEIERARLNPTLEQQFKRKRWLASGGNAAWRSLSDEDRSNDNG